MSSSRTRIQYRPRNRSKTFDSADSGNTVRVRHQAEGDLLDEFFDPDASAPRRTADGSRFQSIRERCWNWFHSRFEPKPPISIARDQPIAPFDVFRSRATELNYHYAGLYRGTFFLNYVLAVLAVMIASFSLLLLGISECGQHEEDGATAKTVIDQARRGEPDVQQQNEHPPERQTPVSAHGDGDCAKVGPSGLLLLALTLLKLAFVFAIFFNTHRANHGEWNNKAINSRYLAERLRMSYYLPLIGSFQPPAAAQTQFASGVLRQSSIDWLFDAIVRSVSPADIAELSIDEPSDRSSTVRMLRVAPARALQAARESWLTGQIAYHKRNAKAMDQLSSQTDLYGKRLNILVIVVVAFDAAALACEALGLFPAFVHEHIHPYTPYFIFVSAVLPAAVAGLNGIRFQSEARRLADRSRAMQRLLEGKAERAAALNRIIEQESQSPETNLGSWAPDVLRLGEAIARDMVEEVAEWSVVYAKDLAEP